MALSLSREQIESLKNRYLNGDISLAELSAISENLISVHVTTSYLKKLSSEQNWSVQQKSKETPVNNANVSDMITNIMLILYESITKDWNENYMVDPAKVNSFMTLLSKANINVLPETQGSNKIPLQQIIEMIKTSNE